MYPFYLIIVYVFVYFTNTRLLLAKIEKIIYTNAILMYIFINKLFDIDLDKYDSDKKCIKERRFEVIFFHNFNYVN